MVQVARGHTLSPPGHERPGPSENQASAEWACGPGCQAEFRVPGHYLVLK